MTGFTQKAAALAFVACLAPTDARALRFTHLAPENAAGAMNSGRPGAEVDIVGHGQIESGDLERLRAALRAVPRQSRLRYLLLDSPGGLVKEGENLANEINRLGITVAIPPGAECASACFLLFAAALHRVAGTGARIGVHSASRNGQETIESLAVTTIMARLAAAYGVPPSVLGKMVRTGPMAMDWLTQADLDAMGVLPLRAPPARTADAPDGFVRPGTLPPQRPGSPLGTPSGGAAGAAAGGLRIPGPFVAPNTPSQPAAAMAAGPEFRGVYFCRNGPASLVLKFEATSRTARATFSFGPTEANPVVTPGSFAVEGRFDPAAGALDLRPISTVSNVPDNAYVAGLSGESSDGGRTFAGRVTTNIHCTRFTLRRVG